MENSLQSNLDAFNLLNAPTIEDSTMFTFRDSMQFSNFSDWKNVNEKSKNHEQVYTSMLAKHFKQQTSNDVSCLHPILLGFISSFLKN